MNSWPAWAARTHFSEMLRAAIKKGPQLITRRGVEVGVLVSVGTLVRLQESARQGLKAVLPSPESRLENLVPKRRSQRHRLPIKF